MEKFKVKKQLMKTLGNEISHLDDVRDLLVCLDIPKHKLRRVFLLQDLLKSIALELYNSIFNDINNGNN